MLTPSAIQQYVASTPWAIVPNTLDALVELLERHAAGIRLTSDEIEARLAAARGGRQAPTRPSAGSGAVAVLPLSGVIAQHAPLVSDVSSGGGTSCEGFQRAFDAALADDNISAIVIDVDSPGGSVLGVSELASHIRASRGQKPIVAIANSSCASAAYWIASAADELWVTQAGEVGSIGVFCVHTDLSAALQEAGVVKTFISAGKYKVEGHPFQPLSEDARAAMQATVDDVYGMFVADVAQNRGATAAAVRTGFGEGRMVMGQKAVAAGMADKVGTLDDVLASLGVGANAPRTKLSAAAPTTDVHATDVHATAGGAAAGYSLPPAFNRPHQAKEIPVSKDTQARTDGAEHDETEARISAAVVQERARANEIRSLCDEHGIEAASAEEMVTSGISVAQASRKILDARSTHAERTRPRIEVGAQREAQAPWRSFGEQLAAVRTAFSPNGARDPRLSTDLQAAASGMNQGVPSEGGFTVAPQFARTIWEGLNAQPDNLLGMTDNYTVEGESLTLLANAETSRVGGLVYGGVQAYWINEADQVTKSKPKLREVKLEPQQLGALVYVTDKLVRNSPVALEQYVSRAAPAAINFRIGESIFAGKGAGKPQGFMLSKALITVPKQSGQANGTIVQENISAMWARLHPSVRSRAIWLHNVDIEPQLDTLSTVVKNVAGTENVGGYANKVFDSERRTLKGRPLVACEFSESLGTPGDLVLVDPLGYVTGTRGGIEQAASMHVRFEYAETAFRFLFEVDGQTWLDQPLTPAKGANTLSQFIALAQR